MPNSRARSAAWKSSATAHCAMPAASAKSDIVLSTAGLKGVTLYEPTEIVMSARAGTPVYEIEAILAARGQMLAFEPVDLGPTTGAPGGALIDRRRLCDEFVWLQADRVGQCAGQSSRRQGGEWPCRAFQVGRSRDEERHRPRRGARPDGELGHARGDDGSDVQGGAAAANDADACVHGPARRPCDRSADGSDGDADRGFGCRTSTEELRVAPEAGAAQGPRTAGDASQARNLRGGDRRAKGEAEGRSQSLRHADRARLGIDLEPVERIPDVVGHAFFRRDELVADFGAFRQRRRRSSSQSRNSWMSRRSTTGRGR